MSPLHPCHCRKAETPVQSPKCWRSHSKQGPASASRACSVPYVPQVMFPMFNLSLDCTYSTTSVPMPHPLKYPYNQHRIPRKVQGLLQSAASSPGNLWDNSKRSSEDINPAASLAPRKPADLPPFRTGPGIFILLPKISGLRSLSGEAACSPAQRRWLCNNPSAGQAARGSEGTRAALPGPTAPRAPGGGGGAVPAPAPAGTQGHGCLSRCCER